MVGAVGVGVEDGTGTLTIVVVITVTVTPTTIAPITDRASVFGSAFKNPPQRGVIDQGASFGGFSARYISTIRPMRPLLDP